MTNEQVPRLYSEKGRLISQADTFVRLHLAAQFRQLPDEVFSRLQYVQPQVGCFNRCAFCSQSAGKDVWQFTRQGLRNFLAAFASVARERTELKVGMARTGHRPGTLFPYLDNDISSYPYLDEFIQYSWEDLGAKVRISSVGYSSLNHELQKMHESILQRFLPAIAGIRFSYTPYTIGGTVQGEQIDVTHRQQFLQDFTNLLSTYRPLVDFLGMGKETACVELRFKPFLVLCSQPLEVCSIAGHHVIHLGPHLLIRQTTGDKPLPFTEIKEVKCGQSFFTQPPTLYFLVTSDKEVEQGDWQGLAQKLIVTGFPTRNLSRWVELFLFSNADGPYYVADPSFLADGTFRALHLYPPTPQRSKSGYTDATRFFLNTLLEYKRIQGLQKRESFCNATPSDITKILMMLADAAKTISQNDRRAAHHIECEVIPMVESYATALLAAGYPPATFFDRSFTVDTGQIVNQGRARHLFHELVSQENEPMTPHEERGYGEISISSQRGTIWRISPVPFLLERKPSKSQIGGKNVVKDRMMIQIQELDPRHLYPIEKKTGNPLREFYIEGAELEHISLAAGQKILAYPGIVPSRS